jgi:hypothetical protein
MLRGRARRREKTTNDKESRRRSPLSQLKTNLGLKELTIAEQCRLIEIEFTSGDGQHSYLESIADTGICPAGTNAGV